MRALAMNEIETVAGANAAVVASVITGIAAFALISAYYSNPCHYVDTPFSTVTPVYDPHTGELLGHQVDEYIKTELVCR